MWGGASSTNPGTSVAAPGPQTSAYYSLTTGPATNSAYTSGLSTSNGGRELDFYNSTLASASGLWFKFTGTISVDEATAQTGNINVTVAGQTSANVTTLVVGSYGSFGNTGAVGTAPTIVAGKAGTTAGEIEIKESIPGSLIWGRTITLTLPSDVAWAQAPVLDTTLSTNIGSIGSYFNDWTTVGTNGTEIQCNLGGATPPTATGGPTSGLAEPGDFFLQNAEVTPAVDFSGPITVTIGGSEGLTGTQPWRPSLPA